MRLKKDFVYGILVGIVITFFLIIPFKMPLTDVGFYPHEGVIIKNLIVDDDVIIGCETRSEIVRNTSTCISVLKSHYGWDDEEIEKREVYCDKSKNNSLKEAVCRWDGLNLEAAIKRWNEQPKAYAGPVIIYN